MLQQENLAANFCGLLTRSYNYKKTAVEWRILGQEEDGSMLASWISLSMNETPIERSHIGLYNPIEKTFRILYSFGKRENCIQASVNSSRTLIAFVLKDPRTSSSSNSEEYVYKPFLAEVKNDDDSPSTGTCHSLMAEGTSQQVMTQFLWQEKSIFEKTYEDKLLLFVHDDCITMVKTKLVKRQNEKDLSSKIDFKDYDSWYLDTNTISREIIVKLFIWAQWDPIVQALYYIHLKPTTKSLLEKDDDKMKENGNASITTLSAHQFHESLPRETVLNIPLNLPNIPIRSAVPSYDDDTVPLRIHDSSLNLIIVTNEQGMLFVCHYCIYQPINLPMDEELDSAIVSPSDNENDKPVQIDSKRNSTVHFSYSVTLLHHGCIIHCAIPGIPLDKAKYMKPTFTMHSDHHMLVYQPDIFCHLLDVGLTHEPCCHIVCSPNFNSQTEQNLTHLVPCLKWGPIAYDTVTMNLISISVPKSHLIEAFKTDKSIDNRISILHYFLMHSNDMDVLSELIAIIMEEAFSSDTVPLLKESFVAGAYASTVKSLPKDALPLTHLLPLTTSNTKHPLQAKVNNLSIGISNETLHSTTMMLLSPQQRLSPFKVDIWTKLWERLNDSNRTQPRFSPETVVEKLMCSLACYQPEALSRCTTPMSPCGPLSPMNFIDYNSRRIGSNNVLPFLELETCTATKQEHVISVNLRELSVYLVKHTAKQNTGFRWLKDAHIVQAPSHVNTIASQYAAAQLELSRALCVFVCRAAGVDARFAPCRGYTLIDTMQPIQQKNLFSILERFFSAAESIAFPLSQGFSSFFSYLGYHALDFNTFLQYVDHNVFELQIDVLNGIFKAIGNSARASEKKHLILSKVPRSRSFRILKTMNDTRTLRVLGRDHANAILSGVSSASSRKNSKTISTVHSHDSSAMPWYETDSLMQIDDETYIDIDDSSSNYSSSDEFFMEKSNDDECCFIFVEICLYLLLTFISTATLFMVIYQYTQNDF